VELADFQCACVRRSKSASNCPPSICHAFHEVKRVIKAFIATLDIKYLSSSTFRAFQRQCRFIFNWSAVCVMPRSLLISVKVRSMSVIRSEEVYDGFKRLSVPSVLCHDSMTRYSQSYFLRGVPSRTHGKGNAFSFDFLSIRVSCLSGKAFS
jgi:hypothetical protein